MSGYAEVIPIRRLPRHLGVFDYRIPTGMTVQPGQVVTVLFRRRPMDALVWRVKATPDPSIPASRLQDIMSSRSTMVVNRSLLHVLHFTADYYLQSPATVANLLLAMPSVVAPVPVSRQQPIRRLQIGGQMPTAWVDDLRQTISVDRQVLILCADVVGVEEMVAALKRIPVSEVVTLHSRLSRAQQQLALRAAANGSRVVVGTRMAVLATFQNLGLIILTNEHREGHKQWDQNPRYHALTVARKLADELGAGLIVSSVWPTVTTLQMARRLGWQVRLFPSPQAKVSVQDLDEERRSGNKTQLSAQLQRDLQRLVEDVNAPRPIWILTNRRGDAVGTRCRDCGTPLRCTQCGTTMGYDAALGDLRCPGCQTRAPLATACPKCGGVSWYRPAFTTDGVSRQVRQLNPALRVATMDATLKPAARDELAAKLAGRSVDVLVGTVAILQHRFPRPPLGVFASFDASLNAADVSATEHTAQVLAELRAVADEVMVQTINPNHPLLSEQIDYLAWAEGELEARRALSYPPYSRLIILIVSSYSAATAENEAVNISDQLRRLPEPTGYALEVLGPVTPAKPVVRRRYRRHILLKLTPTDLAALDHPLPDGALTTFLRELPPHIIVDVDPAELT